MRSYWHVLTGKGLAIARAAARAMMARIAGETVTYRALVEDCPDAILRLGLDGICRYASPAAACLTGMPERELRGSSLLALSHHEERAMLAGALADAIKGGHPVAVGFRIAHAAGQTIWVDANLALVQAGTVPAILAVLRDASVQKQRELVLSEARQIVQGQATGLKEMARQLEAAKNAAEAASQAKSAFLANMSHELRTPLNAIIGFSDLIERESFGPLGDPRYAEFAGDIRTSGQHLLGLINDVLDQAKAEAGRLVLNEEIVEVEGIVAFTLRMLGNRAERSGITLASTVAPHLRLLADDRRLKQILVNLVTNAIKYTPAGGRVTVTAGIEPSGTLVIEVEDSGIGIADSDLTMVLEPYAQVDHAKNRAGEGTGLGLPLTKILTEMHGGTIALRSRQGVGTTVSVRLPAERVVPTAHEQDAVNTEPQLVALVVDDDPDVLSLACSYVEKLGLRVVAAHNANEALTSLRSPGRIDLLFTDIIMPPGMNGIELAAQARALHPSLKILFTTAFGGHTVNHDLGSYGNCRTISKPYTRDELAAELAEMLPLPASGTVVRLASVNAA